MDNSQTLLPSAAAARFDLYTGIHKAVRRYMCDTLTRTAALDHEDEDDIAQGLQQVRELADFCASHVQHENNFLHSAMEARRPGSSGATANDHEHHGHAFAHLRSLADAVEQHRGDARAAALLQLQRYLAIFVGENFIHMNMEETDNQAVLWASYTDAELQALHQALVASVPPAEMAVVLRWMIPAFNPSERAQLLSDMRLHAPAPVFEGALALAREHLSGRDWRKLTQALGMDEKRAA